MEDLFDEVEGSEQDVIRHLIADIRFDADMGFDNQMEFDRRIKAFLHMKNKNRAIAVVSYLYSASVEVPKEGDNLVYKDMPDGKGLCLYSSVGSMPVDIARKYMWTAEKFRNVFDFRDKDVTHIIINAENRRITIPCNIIRRLFEMNDELEKGFMVPFAMQETRKIFGNIEPENWVRQPQKIKTLFKDELEGCLEYVARRGEDVYCVISNEKGEMHTYINLSIENLEELL